MMKVLVLPLFQMPSGHHKVADALIYSLEKQIPSVVCKKIDFLSYCNEHMEKLISEMYIRWIRSYPNSYHHIYKKLMCADSQRLEVAHLEPWLPYFEHKMKKMLEREQPNLIICTHSFPSRVLQRLKKRNRIKTPVINVYTDFFLNGIWGKNGIDYHFVPHQEAKIELMTKHKISKEKIIVTGIPVHETITPRNTVKKLVNRRKHILFAGGNQGLGNIADFFKKMGESSHFQYSVLCGKNEQLYEEILSWNNANIRPLPYISDAEEMNRLYDQVDAIITKPGGVTVSEVLKKRLPLFTVAWLPGQEKINLQYLERRGLIYNLSGLDSYEQKISRVLNDEMEQNRLNKRINEYFEEIEKTAQEAVKDIITASQNIKKQRRY
jgi:processive 1,2-diacylglycerol beta-glucosyltransferase